MATIYNLISFVKIQVFTPKAAALFVATGIGLFFYFRYEKAKLLEQRRAYSSLFHSSSLTLLCHCSERELEDRQVGRPNVGGPFSLLTHEGKLFTEQDLLGKWSLIYFGFTNCPDICPEELDKMSAAIQDLGIPTAYI